MLTLFIIRHAKSSWSFDLRDFERPLGERGRRDVNKMGDYLGSNFKSPELMISSPASRAFYTALFLADQWSYPEEKLVLEPRFYHGSPTTFIEVLSEMKSYQSIAVIGHNPGLTELSNRLCDSYIENISTCGVVRLHFETAGWSELGNKKGKLMDFIKPKDLT